MPTGRKLKTLTYWIADSRNDATCLSLRARRKKDVETMRAESWNPDFFKEPRKVTIEYLDAFDLLLICVGENAPDF